MSEIHLSYDMNISVYIQRKKFHTDKNSVFIVPLDARRAYITQLYMMHVWLSIQPVRFRQKNIW